MADDPRDPHDDALELDEAECLELLDRLFPHGPAGADVLRELAPNGWENSPLNAAFRPPATPAERDADREVRELVGLCLWDVFSDNHDVTAPDGRRASLGSFRGSGGTIAEWVNKCLGHEPEPEESPEAFFAKMRAFGEAFKNHDADAMSALTQRPEKDGVRVYEYVDFYMGSSTLRGRADPSPVWRLIFRRLRGLGCNWSCSFPRLGIVSFAKPEADDDPTSYDPSAAFAAGQEREEQKQKTAEMRESLDRSYRASVEAAKDGPPPPLVLAYQAVYGELPQDWPPEVEDE